MTEILMSKPVPLKIRLIASGIILVSLIALLFICEGILRWTRPDLVPSHQIRMTSDPFMGWRAQPNQILHGRTEHGEAKTVRTNTLGFFDTDHRPSPSHARRIAFLGDSFTGGAHVDFDATFVSVFQKASPVGTEALNFGHSGFGTVNEYLCWRHYVVPFHPQIVLLAFFLGNDVTNNLPDYPVESFRSPKFELDEQGHLREVPFEASAVDGDRRKHRSWFYRTFLQPSVLYQQYKLFERDVRYRLGIRKNPKGGSEDETPFWKRSGSPVDWQCYLPQPDPRVEEAWEITEKLILRLRDEVQTTGARFYLMLIPGMESFQPEEFRKSLERYPGIEAYQFDLEYPRNRMRKFLIASKIPFLDMEEEFRKLPSDQQAGLYFRFDRHFSTLGHRITGESLARFLVEQEEAKHGVPTSIDSPVSWQESSLNPPAVDRERKSRHSF